VRFKHKVEAFHTAQSLSPEADREKTSGFILLVGSGPRVIEAGQDREAAIDRAVEILEEEDTVVFLSKHKAKIGDSIVLQDQLILTRKYE